MPKIDYPKPDGKLTFDKTSSVYLTGTNHIENQPVHLQLKDSNLPINYTLKEYDEPAQRYCPLGFMKFKKKSLSLILKIVYTVKRVILRNRLKISLGLLPKVEEAPNTETCNGR